MLEPITTALEESAYPPSRPSNSEKRALGKGRVGKDEPLRRKGVVDDRK